MLVLMSLLHRHTHHFRLVHAVLRRDHAAATSGRHSRRKRHRRRQTRVRARLDIKFPHPAWCACG